MPRYLFTFLLCLFFLAPAAHAQVVDIVFPVIGDVSYTDDFNLNASQGRIHHGNDLMGAKMMPLVAATAGTVTFLTWPEASYGYYLSLLGDDGYVYNYVHINNDVPGTDDGAGGGRFAYAPYVYSGAHVEAGQLIGYMGDSGNAESVGAHLHFEIRTSDDEAFSPYESLQAAQHIAVPVEPLIEDDEIVPFGTFAGGGRVALGNLDNDSRYELVVGAGAGGGPQIRTYSHTGKVLNSFFAFEDTMSAGVDVATGDLDADGIDEIIVGSGVGVDSRISVFTAKGELMHTIAIDDTAGVRVATADIDFDGVDEIISVPASSGSTTAHVFAADGALIRSFSISATSCAGGFDVAVRSMDVERKPRIAIANGEGCAPLVQIFKRNGKFVRQFFAYDETFTGGVALSLANIDLDTFATEIVVAPASNAQADIRVLSMRGKLKESRTQFEEWWSGGFDIAANDESVYIATGPGGRRVSVREVR